MLEVRIKPELVQYELVQGDKLTIMHRLQPIALTTATTQSVSLLPELEAVIFDLDGVITDTAEYHFLAWKQLADELGLPFNREINERLKGVSRSDSLAIILEQGNLALTEEEKQTLTTRKNEHYKTMIEAMTPEQMLPNIRELLQALKQSGLKLAIASASENAPKVLERLEIIDMFDAVVNPRSARKGKPDPELFLLASEMLGIYPTHCLGVEDSFAGITAIKDARMPAIGIGDSSVLSEADYVVKDTEQLSVAVIQDVFRRVHKRTPAPTTN